MQYTIAQETQYAENYVLLQWQMMNVFIRLRL